MRALVASAAATLAAAAVVANVDASRAPTAAEKTSLVAAVQTYVKKNKCCKAIKRITVQKVLVSTVNPRWARVDVTSFDAGGTALGRGTASVRRATPAATTWVVNDLSKRTFGCHAPDEVKADLHFTCLE